MPQTAAAETKIVEPVPVAQAVAQAIPQPAPTVPTMEEAPVAMGTVAAAPAITNRESVVAAEVSHAAAAATEKLPSSTEEQSGLHVVPVHENGPQSKEHGWHRHRAESAFVTYWREVASSFVRDWRAFFASFSPQASAFAGHLPHRGDALRRKVIAPLRTWLRTPMDVAQRSHGDKPSQRRKPSGKS